MNERSITFRLTADEYSAFNTICSEKGYSKTGKIRECIRNLIKKELEEVTASAAEWAEMRASLKEIKDGKFTTLEEMKRELARKKVGSHNSKQDQARHTAR